MDRWTDEQEIDSLREKLRVSELQKSEIEANLTRLMTAIGPPLAVDGAIKFAGDTLRYLSEALDLLEEMPSGPGEGMVSTPEDAKDVAEWAEKYRALNEKMYGKHISEQLRLAREARGAVKRVCQNRNILGIQCHMEEGHSEKHKALDTSGKSPFTWE